MNINDIDTDAPEEGDWLRNMFRRQAELEKKYEPIERVNGQWIPNMPIDIDDHLTQGFLKDAAYRVIEEISEMTNTLKNKWWKQTQLPTDVVHHDEELADAWHFWIRYALYRFGPDPDVAADTVYRLYFKKSEVNKFRQESKY